MDAGTSKVSRMPVRSHVERLKTLDSINWNKCDKILSKLLQRKQMQVMVEWIQSLGFGLYDGANIHKFQCCSTRSVRCRQQNGGWAVGLSWSSNTNDLRTTRYWQRLHWRCNLCACECITYQRHANKETKQRLLCLTAYNNSISQ